LNLQYPLGFSQSMFGFLRRSHRAIAESAVAAAADCRGSTITTFALSLPIALGCIGLATDYSNWSRSKTLIQSAADQSALAAARELRLGNSNASTISQVAQSFALAALSSAPGTPTISTAVASDKSNVTVTINLNVTTTLPQALGLPFATVRAKARARVLGGAPLCILSLTASSAQGLMMTLGSHVTAANCSIYSDSTAANGLAVLDTSLLTSPSICSSGGYSGTNVNYSTMPQVDCPVLTDPLSARPSPSVTSTCDHTNLTIVGQTVNLLPGTYCGGLQISGGATVTLSPGVYIIKDGPLTVTSILSRSTLKGSNIGFFLTGNNSALSFLGISTIDLTAPQTGAMAGILIWEDAATATPNMPHLIYSDQARNLLGTIYLPKGHLVIGSPNPVADQSDYTIIVAAYVVLAASPNLVLNANYQNSLVPVPQGLGPNRSVSLDQ
jgi:Flp pilus assembly protein TadG